MHKIETDILDVLIVGAGISGIGCAAHLRRSLPSKSFAILEMRDDLGGTWDLFRYPGIRSDSDLYTFSYGFKPWRSENAIAEGAEIKAYIAETADDYDIRRHIKFGRKVLSYSWNSSEGLWTVAAQNTKTGRVEHWRCRWIFSASGYYDYDKGFRPDFPGEEDFQGAIIHPQHWPQELDYTGKRIAVIGSGATAITLLPALARKAAHVVQVQRTPSYVMPVPQVDPLLRVLRPLLSEERLHRVMRRKGAHQQRLVWRLSKAFPGAMRRLIRRTNRKALPKDFAIDTHFNPPYNPWDQRLCAVPNGDLYKSLSNGDCSIVTGKIERFTATGIKMQSGEHVDADIIVTATGLNLKLLGGIEGFVDGEKIKWADRIVYRGMMLDGIPNLSFAIGYTTSSWTLKIDLLCEYFCRLLAEMDERGADICVATRPADEMKLRPLLDFGAGYVQRSINSLPSQGDRHPWQMTFNYIEDEKLVRRGSVADSNLKFSRRTSAPSHVHRQELSHA